MARPARLRVRPAQCAGEVCVACLRPITGAGTRLTYATMTTHAHPGCAPAARALLADPVPTMV